MFKWIDYEKKTRCFVDGITEQEVANIDINKYILMDSITGKKFTLDDVSMTDAKKSAEDILIKHWNETNKLIEKALNGIK